MIKGKTKQKMEFITKKCKIEPMQIRKMIFYPESEMNSDSNS